jgi:hypothetical protein
MANVSPKVQAIADEIEALTPAARLRLAADLIESKNFSVAHSIVRKIADELQMVEFVQKRAASLPNGSDEAPK